jgi:hypothetical protein
MLYIAVVRYKRSIAAISYLVLVVFGADQQFFFDTDMAVLLCLLLTPLTLGGLAGRWWVLSLPLVAALVSIPFGYPENIGGEPLPTWFNLLFIAPVQLALIAVGVGGRKLWNRRHRAEVA